VIQLYGALLARLGITEFSLALNSIGCRECRPAYIERLEAWLARNLDRLDEPTRERAGTNPLRVFDNLEAKPAEVRDALREAPTIGQSLCDACQQHFATVRRDLDAYGVSYRLVPTLVRGLDYYTRTTWEFVGPDEGAQSALSGGGRYDGLVEEIGGPATPGVGFGAGIERLVLALEYAGVEASPPAIDVFFALGDGAPRERVAGWLQELRARGVASDTDYAGRSLKGQLTQAARLGAATVVVVRVDGATIRRPGQADEGIALDEVSARLSS
jgi:histidyl-tRNA synthetase